MNKHEVKFSNTAKRMQQALLELLTEKDFTDISIAEICKRAGINRSTFYAHYDNTAELVAETENYLIAEFESENIDLIKNRIIDDVNNPQINLLIDNKILSKYLELVKRYRHVFFVYNKSPILSK